jgi:hypothetical protein
MTLFMGLSLKKKPRHELLQRMCHGQVNGKKREDPRNGVRQTSSGHKPASKWLNGHSANAIGADFAAMG